MKPKGRTRRGVKREKGNARQSGAGERKAGDDAKIKVEAAEVKSAPAPIGVKEPSGDNPRRSRRRSGEGVFAKDTNSEMMQVEKDASANAPSRIEAKVRRGEAKTIASEAAFTDLGPPAKTAAQIKRNRILADKWDLLPDILNVRGLVKQHIMSYDNFINHGLQKVIDANSEIRSDMSANFCIKYKKVYVGRPTVREESFKKSFATPMMCRIRDLTYSSKIEVDVEYSVGGGKTYMKRTPLGRIPIMLRSSKCVLRDKSERQLASLQECPLDPGGYFVVRGFEKVILIQEQLKNNRIFIDYDDSEALQASVVSATLYSKSRTMIIQKRGRFYVQHNKFTHEIPFVIMMKAMGVSSDQEIVSLVGATPEIARRLALSMQEAAELGVFTETQAMHFIGGLVRPSSYTMRRRRTRMEEARMCLGAVILVHVPVDKFHSFRDKSIFLALMVNRILKAELDPRMISDKDYYGNKRLVLAGGLMQLLFEDLFKIVNTNIKRHVDKVFSRPNRASAFDPTKVIPTHTHTITNGFISALASGNWVLRRFRMDQKGVTETVSRLSYIAALGHMTRVRSNVEKSRKVSGPRALQGSQWGMVCPADTPEGEQCGLVKSLALLAHITNPDENEGFDVERLLIDMGVEGVGTLVGEEMFGEDAYLVLINGRIVGATHRAHDLIRSLKMMRRRGCIGEFVSFYIHTLERSVYVSTDGGRVCRPLIVVHRKRALLKQNHIQQLVDGIRDFHSLVHEGRIEYVDVNEENSCNIALTPDDITSRTTHVEIDPVTIMGIVSALIPFPHHNQSPRNTYQCAMGKQAIGSLGFNQNLRCNLNPLNTLVYPQKPMIRSRVLDFVHFDKLGGGQNAMVAVMSFSGYDIEDALIVNRASLDRGYGRANIVKRFTTVMKKHNNCSRDIFKAPDLVRPEMMKKEIWDRRMKMYECLGTDGIVEAGGKIHERSVMINRYVPADDAMGGSQSRDQSRGNGSRGMRSSPVYYKEPGTRTVEKVTVMSGRDKETTVKVLIRDCRRPELGDKYSSRHGQKGVIGLIVPQEDLPFSETGVCPDMIMNPHGFPSRMTVGKMIELVDGKAGLLDGKRRFGTAFGGDSVVECGKILMDSGLSYSGKELLYSGLGGDVLEAYIFFGPIYYQRLKHMVKDKMFARSRGPHVVLTRQPTQGRSRNGGLRVGEMERDCLVAHGVSLLLVERMLISSDPFTASVCSKCGILAYTGYCQYCKSGSSVSDFRVPYACKLLFQELMSMNVQPRIRLSEGGFFDESSSVVNAGNR
eukprot:g2322.t1